MMQKCVLIVVKNLKNISKNNICNNLQDRTKRDKGEKKLKCYEKKLGAKKWGTPPWEKGLFWDRR